MRPGTAGDGIPVGVRSLLFASSDCSLFVHNYVFVPLLVVAFFRINVVPPMGRQFAPQTVEGAMGGYPDNNSNAG